MKILITGSTGKVGEAVSNIFLREYPQAEILLLTGNPKEIKPRDRTPVFQAFYDDVKWVKSFVLEHKPNIIVNCAAMTNVDACEDEKEKAMQLNAKFPESLAIAAKKVDAHLITFSTDYVFNGESGPYTELDVPDPINYYGKSKLAGENLAKVNCDKLTIIRTNVVYGMSSYGKSDFIRWILAKLKLGDSLKIITGQWCNPTFSDDLAWVVMRVVETQTYGVLNVAGKDWLNRYEIALIVAETFGYDKNRIEAIDPDELKQKAARPEKGGLVITSVEGILGVKLSGLKEGLTTLNFQLNELEI
jgi:dTDP-4-dehydrorhamnose reductase